MFSCCMIAYMPEEAAQMVPMKPRERNPPLRSFTRALTVSSKTFAASPGASRGAENR